MNIAEVLREHGYKVTPQRLAVYDVIDHNLTHPNAEVIYKELQPKYPSMSLATVYKTMEIFAKIGVVQILQCEEDAHRYDYNTEPHAHVRCSQCNRIRDIEIDQDQLSHEAAEKTGYQIDSVTVSFTGICPECLAKQK
ncbi:Fur family transcriptional regulator [Megasphaera vaginalis (ex Srinivasan et al. 2021)]|uniref:Ferric uptake regulator family protein n=1 Tax=Megasphaera vaginalis (ex Srinivasan et al. 2021) TaxID=1111454 RepID=U7UW80_9FIRM|nr:Fur family transcriptional regulator [Megasphaera vaginalis (ex Srinivasan et al. 2021)]ERT62718.1 ferric uptake regulator family protein [Megasphaera vaginalis (ex Srinivasan et al. 2021)]